MIGCYRDALAEILMFILLIKIDLTKFKLAPEQRVFSNFYLIIHFLSQFIFSNYLYFWSQLE